MLTITEYINSYPEGKKTNGVSYVFPESDDGNLNEQPMYLGNDGSKGKSLYHTLCPQCDRYCRHDMYLRTKNEIDNNRIRKKPCNDCKSIPDTEERERLESIVEQKSGLVRPYEEEFAKEKLQRADEIEDTQQRQLQELEEILRRKEEEQLREKALLQDKCHELQVRCDLKDKEILREKAVLEGKCQQLQEECQRKEEEVREVTSACRRAEAQVSRQLEARKREQAAHKKEKEQYQEKESKRIEEEKRQKELFEQNSKGMFSSIVQNMYPRPYDPLHDVTPTIGDGWWDDKEKVLCLVTGYTEDGSIVVDEIEPSDGGFDEGGSTIDVSVQHDVSSGEISEATYVRYVWSMLPAYLAILALPYLVNSFISDVTSHAPVLQPEASYIIILAMWTYSSFLSRQYHVVKGNLMDYLIKAVVCGITLETVMYFVIIFIYAIV